MSYSDNHCEECGKPTSADYEFCYGCSKERASEQVKVPYDNWLAEKKGLEP